MSTASKPKRTSAPRWWRYVIVWMIAGFLSGLARILIDKFLVFAMVRDVGDLAGYFVATYLVMSAATLGIWIWIYSLFRSLDIARVIPWMWGLGAFGVVVSASHTASELSDLGVSSALPIILNIACFVGIVLFFRAHFRAKGRA